MRFNFRKIASALASTAMVSSTVALAAAATFPAPFVEDDVANVAIVTGAAAASSDLVAAVDIVNALDIPAEDGGDVTIEGESYPLFGSGDNKIWHNSTINSQRTSVTDSDLPSVLGDSEISGNVDADITHILTVGAFPRFKYSQQPTSDDDPTWNIELSTTAANSAYNASVTFDRAVNFTHADTEGETFMMFGQEFTVGSATDETNLVLFRASETLLLDSSSNPSQSVTIEGETYTVELAAASDTSATVRLTDSAGNSDQKEINEASSKKILGIEVGVNTADESDALGTISAEVIVGANKLTLSNGNAVLFGPDQDAIDGTRVTFRGTTYPGNITHIDFQSTTDDSDEDAILPGDSFVDPVLGGFSLVFANIAGDDERESISVQNAGDEKMIIQFTDHQGSDSGSLNFIYNETIISHPEAASSAVPILADSGGDLIHYGENVIVNRTHYLLVGDAEENDGRLLEVTQVTNQSSGFSNDKVDLKDAISGDTYSLSISAEGTGTVNIGGVSYTVTYSGASGSEEETFFVRVDDPNTGTGAFRLFPPIETQSGAKVLFYQPTRINLDTYGGFLTGAQNVSSLSLPDGDGYTAFAVANGWGFGGQNWTIGGSVVNASATTSSVNVTSGRLTWAFVGTGVDGNATVDMFLLTPGTGARLDEPGLVIFEEEDDSNNYEAIVVETEGLGTDADGLGVSTAHRTSLSSGGFGPTSFITHDSDTDISSAATRWGTVLTLDAGESDQKTLEVSYPDEQINAEVYIAAADAVTGGSGSVGGITVSDSEVSSVQTKNLIVIGGSCVNTVAASLLGSDVPLCGSDFTDATEVGAGQYLIQTFESPYSSGRIATLVAGYNAGDTTNAAAYLRTQNPTTDVGAKYIGTSGTTATLQ